MYLLWEKSKTITYQLYNLECCPISFTVVVWSSKSRQWPWWNEKVKRRTCWEMGDNSKPGERYQEKGDETPREITSYYRVETDNQNRERQIWNCLERYFNCQDSPYVLMFLSLVPYVPLSFTKQTCCTAIIKKDAINKFGIKYWISNHIKVKLQEPGSSLYVNIEKKRVWLLVGKYNLPKNDRATKPSP